MNKNHVNYMLLFAVLAVYVVITISSVLFHYDKMSSEIIKDNVTFIGFGLGLLGCLITGLLGWNMYSGNREERREDDEIIRAYGDENL